MKKVNSILSLSKVIAVFKIKSLQVKFLTRRIPKPLKLYYTYKRNSSLKQHLSLSLSYSSLHCSLNTEFSTLDVGHTLLSSLCHGTQVWHIYIASFLGRKKKIARGTGISQQTKVCNTNAKMPGYHKAAISPILIRTRTQQCMLNQHPGCALAFMISVNGGAVTRIMAALFQEALRSRAY